MKKPMRIVILFSGGASGWKYLKNEYKYGKDYVIVGAFTNKEGASAISAFENDAIPCEVLDYKKWIAENKIEDKKERRTRYFDEVIQIVEKWNPDVVLLSGFMLLVTSNFFNHFFAVNVHPANLSLCDAEGERKYTGDKAVELALQAGEKETCSTLHQLNEQADRGPIIAISDPLPVPEGALSAEHQENMKWQCDGPVIVKGLDAIMSGAYVRK